jgi:hypothetical protein
MKALVWLLLAIAAAIVEAELIAWCPPLQRWLIRRAAAPLPQPQRDRYTEEWFRELEEQPDGPLTRLTWVLSLLLRRRSLVRAIGPSPTVDRSTSRAQDAEAPGLVTLLFICGAIVLGDGIPVAILTLIALHLRSAVWGVVAGSIALLTLLTTPGVIKEAVTVFGPPRT